MPELDLVVVPIGGGGLCAGVSSALKLLQPSCKVIGVEPAGADSMYRSFAAGEPRSIERVNTIADSLGAPYTMPISFELCRRNVDELVLVSDDELRAAMRLLLRETKLAVEPAGAAATAALLGPLRSQSWVSAPRSSSVDRTSTRQALHITSRRLEHGAARLCFLAYAATAGGA